MRTCHKRQPSTTGSSSNYVGKQMAGSPAHCTQKSIFRILSRLLPVFRFLPKGRPVPAASCITINQSEPGILSSIVKKQKKNSLNTEMEKKNQTKAQPSPPTAPLLRSNRVVGCQCQARKGQRRATCSYHCECEAWAHK